MVWSRGARDRIGNWVFDCEHEKADYLVTSTKILGWVLLFWEKQSKNGRWWVSALHQGATFVFILLWVFVPLQHDILGIRRENFLTTWSPEPCYCKVASVVWLLPVALCKWTFTVWRKGDTSRWKLCFWISHLNSPSSRVNSSYIWIEFGDTNLLAKSFFS